MDSFALGAELRGLEEEVMRNSISYVDGELKDINDAIKEARESNVDLSIEYLDESLKGYQLQQTIRLATRSLDLYYLSLIRSMDKPFELSFLRVTPYKNQLEDVLNTLHESLELFGKHPFHHVIEGRIAKIVQEANHRRLEIPDQFERYKNFEIKPYNSPSLNYNTPHDIPTDKAHFIPPDWVVA